MKSITILMNIFLCLLIAYSEATEFRYSTSIQCDIGSRWCYFIKFLEADVFAPDFIGKTPERCQDKNVAKEEFVGTLGGEDGLFDHTFEPYMEVHHNCTVDGHKRKLTHKLESVPTSSGKYVKDNMHLNLGTSGYKEV